MLDRPLQSDEIKQMVALRNPDGQPTYAFICCMREPYRIGTLLFSQKLEYDHYTPETPAEHDFIPMKIFWPEEEKDRIEWWVIRIPYKDLPVAKAVAASSAIPMRIGDGVPNLIDAEGVKSWPWPGPNVFTLENTERSGAYDNRKHRMLQELEAAEQAKLDRQQENFLISKGLMKPGETLSSLRKEAKVIGKPSLLVFIRPGLKMTDEPKAGDVKLILVGDVNRAHDIYKEFIKKPSPIPLTIDAFMAALMTADGFRKPTEKELTDRKLQMHCIPWRDIPPNATSLHWANISPKGRV